MNKNSTYTLDSVVDETIGVIGTPNRDRFEEKIKIELIEKMIEEVCQEKKGTPEE